MYEGLCLKPVALHGNSVPIMESMAPTAAPSSSVASGTVAPRTSSSPSVKRSDSGVALGLFSKIAAARKEKLSPFVTPAFTAVNDVDPSNARRGSTPPPMASQFPDIHDTSTRFQNTNGRAATAKKGAASRGFEQTLRWTKREETRSRSSSSGPSASMTTTTPPIATPSFPSARASPARLATPERSRRSLYDIGRTGTAERILPLEDLVSRPSTAGDDPALNGVRGYVRRPLDAGTNNFELPVHSRTSDWTQPYKANTADGSSRSGSPLALRGQPELLVLESPSNGPPEHEGPEQEIYFAETSENSGVPVVYRHQKAKASNPERLNLDRRNLAVLPLLEGEQMLRLLNLQNNVIRKIDNLVGLPNLIFLDLYNNRIEKLENFQVLPNLRVLMLGKNRLKRIENLDNLKKLDVLDLHSNDIARMENLNELPELRVLNLGGNKIVMLEGIDKLGLLTELNLRRNMIATISSNIGRLASLQRLFLSNNKLEKLEALEPLFQVASIVELRLDNNLVCETNQAEYRSRMIKSFPLLKHLDLRSLSDAERKEGLLFYSQIRQATKDRVDLEETQRLQTIAHIRALWEKRERLPRNRAQSSAQSLVKRPSGSLRGVAEATTMWGKTKGPSAGLAAHVHTDCQTSYDGDSKPSSREDAMVYKSKAGYSEVEVHGDYRVLAIYGEALEALESAKIHANIHAINFSYISVDRISFVANSPTSANLKLFARLRRVNFAHNDVDSFQQLAWLAVMGSKAEELFITHNAVCSRSLLRQFVAARICNVARLNGREITTAERLSGRQLFQKAATRVKPPEVLGTNGDGASVRGKDKDAVLKLPPNHRSGTVGSTSYVVNDIVVCASEMEKKSTVLEDTWRTLLTVIAKETLQEVSQHEGNYMSGCLDGL